MTPKRVVEILAKHGTTISEDEAGKVLGFLELLATISLEQIFENAREMSAVDFK